MGDTIHITTVTAQEHQKSITRCSEPPTLQLRPQKPDLTSKAKSSHETWVRRKGTPGNRKPDNRAFGLRRGMLIAALFSSIQNVLQLVLPLYSMQVFDPFTSPQKTWLLLPRYRWQQASWNNLLLL